MDKTEGILLYDCIQKNPMEYLTGSILLALVSMTMQLLRDLIEETGRVEQGPHVETFIDWSCSRSTQANMLRQVRE